MLANFWPNSSALGWYLYFLGTSGESGLETKALKRRHVPALTLCARIMEMMVGTFGVQISPLPCLETRCPFGIKMVALPCHVINQPCLQKQVSPGQQVVTDQILVGSHGHPIAETEGTKDI